MKSHSALLLTILIATQLLLVGCAETINTHGQVILPSRLAQIKPGQTTRDEILQLLGSPSTQGTLNDNRWYYITSTMGTKALEASTLKSRKIILIDFDPATGLVSGLQEKTEADGQPLEPVKKSTATQGQSLGIVEQLFGNLGLGPK